MTTRVRRRLEIAGSIVLGLFIIGTTAPTSAGAIGAINKATSWRQGLTPGPRGGAPSVAASGWNLQKVPAVTVPGGTLTSVSCPSHATCVAVGSTIDRAGGAVVLAEDWNGKSWQVMDTPDPSAAAQSGLSGVSCPAAEVCVAVGSWQSSTGQSAPLAERWDGSDWSILSTPYPVNAEDASLSGVSCPSPIECEAVGSFSGVGAVESLAEAWDGTRWILQRTPNVPNPSSYEWGSLSAVSCSTTSSCTAVGQYANASTTLDLAEAWNGRSWSIESTPDPGKSTANQLYGVDCLSRRACEAVGDSSGASVTGTVAEIWNGRSWTIQPTPMITGAQITYLAAVSCTTVHECTAVGATVRDRVRRALAESFNGSEWQVQIVPSRSGSQLSELAGVACSTDGNCGAVGDSANAVTDVTFVVAWNGMSWSIVTSPSPSGSLATILGGVSCVAGGCVAVGYYITPTDTDALAEVWTGSTWTIVRPPDPAGAQITDLAAVSCLSTTDCVAVGTYFDGAENLTLAENWNGSTWTIAPTPNPSGAYTSVLSAISCPGPAECEAVGYYSPALGTLPVPLAEVWNGSSWKIQSTPVPPDAVTATLAAVSCPTLHACSAAGEETNATTTVTLVEAWNGAAWSIQPSPNPEGVGISSFYAVSCPAVDRCEAVGSSSSGELTTPLAAAWDGTSWSLQPISAPSDASGTLLGVSCPSTEICDAVGYASNPDGTDTTLAEAWNGTSWTIASTPDPPGSQYSYVNAGSCSATSTCTAVGDYQQTAASPPLPLSEARHG